MVKAVVHVIDELSDVVLDKGTPALVDQSSYGQWSGSFSFQLTSTPERRSLTKDVDYGSFESPQRDASQGRTIHYVDVTGHEHHFRSLRHLSGDGTVDGTGMLDQDLPPLQNPHSIRVIVNTGSLAAVSASGYSRVDYRGGRYTETCRGRVESEDFGDYAAWYVYGDDDYVDNQSGKHTYGCSVSVAVVSYHNGQFSMRKADLSSYRTPLEQNYLNLQVKAHAWAAQNGPTNPKYVNFNKVEGIEAKAKVAMSKLLQLIALRLPSPASADREVCHMTWGERDNPIPAEADLCARALEKIGTIFDGNGFAYMQDCKNFIPSILQLKNSILHAKSVGKSPVIIRTIAGAWLGLHYGFELFARDTGELIQAASTQTDFTLYHSAASESYSRYGWEGLRRYTVVFDKTPIMDTMQAFLDKYDLLFRTENAWDLVPYSFVVDWFADIQSSLSVMDNYAKLRRMYNIVAGIGTFHATKVVDFNDVEGVTGTVLCEYFSRTVSDQLTPPDPFAASDPAGFSKKHAVEAGALIIAK